MKEYFYLLSGNIDPSKDTNKIHNDILSVVNNEVPHITLFATASTGTDWHESYKNNVSMIFSNYSCTFEIIDIIDDYIPEKLSKTDVVYFLGGSPYKHSFLTKYREDFQKIPVKVGTSAGAIYLGYHTFFAGKDDYVIAVPHMLDFVDLHVLPHSETHKEEIVFNYLVNEVKINVLRIYNQAGLKIEYQDGVEKVTTLMGNSEIAEEKIELILTTNYHKAEEDKILNLSLKLLKD